MWQRKRDVVDLDLMVLLLANFLKKNFFYKIVFVLLENIFHIFKCLFGIKFWLIQKYFRLTKKMFYGQKDFKRFPHLINSFKTKQNSLLLVWMICIVMKMYLIWEMLYIFVTKHKNFYVIYSVCIILEST